MSFFNRNVMKTALFYKRYTVRAPKYSDSLLKVIQNYKTNKSWDFCIDLFDSGQREAGSILSSYKEIVNEPTYWRSSLLYQVHFLKNFMKTFKVKPCVCNVSFWNPDFVRNDVKDWVQSGESACNEKISHQVYYRYINHDTALEKCTGA